MADDFLRRVLLGDADAIDDAINSGDLANVNRQLAARHYPHVLDLEGAEIVVDALRTIVELVQASEPPARPVGELAVEIGRDLAVDSRVA